MLRVSHLRKLVKPASNPCPDPVVALLGTEVGAPVSDGLLVNVLEGTVVATGAGYDFTDGVLSVTTAEQCPVNSEMTFSITGTGPVPILRVAAPANYMHLVAVTGGHIHAAYRYPPNNWAIKATPLAVPYGEAYELKCSIADEWVGLWLNGSRVARAAVSRGYLATTLPWEVLVGRYYNAETYTGHVDSVSLANGALPDIDVL